MYDKKKGLVFHEDDYRLIELIPDKNYFFSKKQIDDSKVDYHNEYGYKTIDTIKKQPAKLIDEKVLVTDVEEILNSICEKRTNNVKKGYSRSYSKLKNIKAWGLEYSVIFIEYSKKYIESIWFLEIGGDIVIKDDKGEKIVEVLHKLGEKYNLILIDWRKDVIVNIANVDQTKNYVKKLGYKLTYP